MKIRLLTTDEFSVFWEKLYDYFDRDMDFDAEDREYFFGGEYRDAVNALLNQEDEPLKVYFSEENGEYRGFCSLKNYPQEGGKCFILEFCVDGNFRGRGLGREFFSLIERQTDCEFFELTSDNAYGFWEKLGFSHDGTDEDGRVVYRKARDVGKI